jgi:spore coat polysaccharide biosynthesis protein SpsF
VFRGSLDDVVERFQGCLQAHPCEWFVRVSGDSPAIDPRLLQWMIAHRSAEFDLLTNVQRRTFPSGQSVEVVKTATFQAWKSCAFSDEEREHLTQHFYRHADRFRIRNVVLEAEPPHRRMVVDTPEDLVAMESILASPAFPFAASARLDQVAA